MFGLNPVTQDYRPRSEGVTVYEAGIIGALLVGLGLACMILGLAQAPRILVSDTSFLVIGLPLVVASILGVTLGYANLHTRIRMGGGRLDIVAPSYRGLPVPPIQHLSVAIDEVRTIRRRKERLRLLPGLALPIDVYAIETDRGQIVVGGYYQGDIDTALTEIFARSGCGRVEDAEVTVGLLSNLFSGAVPFETDGAGARGQARDGWRP